MNENQPKQEDCEKDPDSDNPDEENDDEVYTIEFHESNC